MEFHKKLLLLVLLVPLLLFSQEQNFSVFNIADSLKTNANAIIRYSSKEVIVRDEKNATIKSTEVITVLNKEGDKFVRPYKFYDKDSKILKISAIVYDSFGMETRKYKKKQFKDHSAVSGFYSDDRVKYINYISSSYPYTIKFSYEYKTHTTAFLPNWNPVPGYNIAVEHSEYLLENPKEISLNIKENNFDKGVITTTKTSKTLRYKLKNSKVFKKENNGLNFYKVAPNSKFCLQDFTLKGYTAYGIKTWEDFGKWLSLELYNSQLELSEETKKEILELVKDEQDLYRRAKIVYEYMQQKTRYVYVGIGIGGWQPNKASEVDRLSYGDCKGLSNYTKALLDVVGVPSNLVIVYAKKRRDFEKEFYGLQGNHMILNLPNLNNGKDVWLECTSQTIPFGFLGDFTDDRDVLVLENGGGVIKRTPKYIDQKNIQTSNGNLRIDESGNLEGALNIVSTGLEYDKNYRLAIYDEVDLKKYYNSKRWYYNNNLGVQKYSFDTDKDEVIFKEKLQLSLQKYASILGDEMIFRVNVFNMYRKSLSKTKKRTQPFVKDRGFVHNDTLRISIPKGYRIENLPSRKVENDLFGFYKTTTSTLNDSEVLYVRKLYLAEGEFDVSEYRSYVKFISAIRKADNAKIVLKKL